MADNNEETYEESITSLDLMRQEQESAHPTDTPATTDLVYAQRGTGSDRNRVWTLSEIFALLANESITELVIPAQGGKARLTGGKLKFEALDGQGEPNGNKAEFAYNGGIKFTEGDVVKFGIVKDTLTGTYDTTFYDGTLDMGMADGDTRVLVNKWVSAYNHNPSAGQPKATITAKNCIAIVRSVPLSGQGAYYIDEVVISADGIEFWSEIGPDGTTVGTLSKVRTIPFYGAADTDVDNIVVLGSNGESGDNWEKKSEWSHKGQTKYVFNNSSENKTVGYYPAWYNSSHQWQAADQISQMTIEPYGMRKFVYSGIDKTISDGGGSVTLATFIVER